MGLQGNSGQAVERIRRAGLPPTRETIVVAERFPDRDAPGSLDDPGLPPTFAAAAHGLATPRI